MAAPSYTTDLQNVSTCESTTGWSELSGHLSGGAPAQDGEAYLEGSNCISQATGQALGTAAGVEFDYGSNISWTTGYVFLFWQMFAAPNNIDSWAAGGMRIGVGSSTGNMKFWNALGRDFGRYPYGGWQNTAIDPTFTGDSQDGTPAAGSYRVFGSLPNMLAKITKGSPHCIDAIRYGRGSLRVINGDVTNGYGTFTGAANANDAASARWGLLQATSGGFLWKGLLSLGTVSASVDFRDSNKSITVDDTPRTYAGFNKIEVNHASSRVDLTSISISAPALSITGSAPISPGDFHAVANADINIDGCTFTDLGTFIFQSNSTVIGTTFRRCGQITQGGSTISDSLIASSKAASAILSNNVAALAGSAFISAGTGHAIELTSAHAGNTYALTNITFSGYAAVNGTTGNEAIYNNSGGHVTLNISGGSTPTIRNSAGSTTTVNSTVSVTLTANVSLVGAEIRVYDLNNVPAGSYGTELAGTESNGTATYTYGGTASNVVLFQIMLNGFEEFVQQYTIPGSNASLDVRLVPDNNA